MDEDDVPETTDVPTVKVEGLEDLQNATSQMVEMGNKLTSILEKISSEVGSSDSALQRGFQKTKESIDATVSSAGRLYDNVEIFSTSRGVENLKNNFAKAGQVAIQTAAEIYKAFTSSNSALNSMGTILNASIPLMAAFGQQRAIKALGDDVLMLNRMLKEVDKQAIQTTVSLSGMKFPGAEIGEAVQYAKTFNAVLGNTIITTRSNRDEVLAVNKAFTDFGIDAIKNSQELIGTITGLNSALNLQNQALLISKATGLDSTQVAKDMAEMHKTLGISVEKAAEAFVIIDDVGRRSNIGIGLTRQSIIGLTKDLKFWGTTVEGIAPIFESFINGLKGTGREGLTPELLQDYVGGLQRMNFSTRALLGLQSPGMRAGGALGAGLQMEQALEEGDFGKISENLIGALKQFGGPLLTRREAIDTGQERQYMLQRQLVGQMTGISDPAKADLMLKTLQSIDAKGVEAPDAIKSLGDLYKRGESIAEETLSLEDKATQEITGSIHISGKLIVDEIAKLSQSMGIAGFLQDVSEILRGGIQMGGFDPKIIGSMIDTVTNKLSDPGGLGQHVPGMINQLTKEIESLHTGLESTTDPKKRAAIEQEINLSEETLNALKELSSPVDPARKEALEQAAREFTIMPERERAIKEATIVEEPMARESALAQTTQALERLKNQLQMPELLGQSLTRREALETGQEKQYLIQRQLQKIMPQSELPELEVREQAEAAGMLLPELAEPMTFPTAPETAEAVSRRPIEQEVELTVKIKTELTDDGRIIIAAQQAVFDKLPAWLHAEAMTGRGMG